MISCSDIDPKGLPEADSDSTALAKASAGLFACFEYIGRTALVLTGPYTGQKYHFEAPGARLLVDGRDQHAMLAVPVLRPINP